MISEASSSIYEFTLGALMGLALSSPLVFATVQASNDIRDLEHRLAQVEIAQR